jgi:hypothetical protein
MPREDLPTADQLVEIFHEALAAGNMRGVEAALLGLAVQDPHRADNLWQTLKLSVALVAAADAGELGVTRDGLRTIMLAGDTDAGDDRVITLMHGSSAYARLLEQIRQDSELVAAMWSDAESHPDELDVPGTFWTITVDGGRPAAWCAARVVDGVLKCHSNYEVRACRGRGLYEAADRARHQRVVLPLAVPAVTYLFAQPIGLHEADGWHRTGLTGPGALDDHQWWELRREAPRA